VLNVDDRLSWTRYQPGLAGASAPAVGQDIAERRYELEPHILEVVPFNRMRGHVVELGCGVSTDGLQISAGAERYVGVDFSPLGLRTASTRHSEAGRLNSTFVRADLRALPFSDDSFDYVYSHGVVHHVRAGDDVWAEASRVLRPGGQFCVMVYHRGSINYRYGIQFLRRLALLVAMLARPIALRLAASRGEDEKTLAGHATNLKQIGVRYLIGTRWLSANTDGPSNTYSRVYSRQELRRALNAAGLAVDAMEVRYLNARVNPPLQGLSPQLASWLAKRWGWHLYAIGHKNERSTLIT
jgi:ubiquinone/menaquinone biosynthesis C-methylase UbiE